MPATLHLYYASDPSQLSPNQTHSAHSISLTQISPNMKVLFLLVLFALLLVPPSSSSSSSTIGRRRDLLDKNHDSDGGVQLSLKKKPSGTTPPALGTTTLTKNNKTKLIKPTNSTNIQKLQEKPVLKKLNSTSKPPILTKLVSKPSNSTKPTSKTSNSTKPISKSANPSKPTSKTTNSTKPTSGLTQKSTDPEKKNTKLPTSNQKSTKKVNTLTSYDDEENDFVSEFRDLPSRFQETLIPDLEVISTTSKAYINKANKQISKNFNPIVGKKYAPMVASFISFAFAFIPFLLVSLIFNRIKAYFSLQRLIIFIQIYLSIYFSILSLSSLVTGLEPLKFFYATSQSTYVCLQLLQTLAYVLYLLVLLMYFVLVFSTDSSAVSKLLGLGQTFVGFAVGLHYYMTVFHRAVLRQPPKTSWKVHAVYATCFLLICLLGTAERRKKAYVVDGSEEGKKS
ncbi:hypothetical protein SSX86_032170 [Deinandra increscens subsp. villosa]|uniref:Uncharacterized protein n=1 Tax=Deinandra increscens subsp. villosa TaxID=3103831 RepID=A0AAP0C8M4_9ASTR